MAKKKRKRVDRPDKPVHNPPVTTQDDDNNPPRPPDKPPGKG